MPYKNKVRKSQSDSVYHLYGRGLGSFPIYYHADDYKLFLYLLKKYLTPGFKEIKIFRGEKVAVLANSVVGLVEVYCYCLMPTHFHMLVKNLETRGITELMRRVIAVYTNYFNTKYERQGQLIQGGYRAVLVTNDNQFVHISRYIHLNPVKAGLSEKVVDYPYNSYLNYLNRKLSSWLVLNERLLGATDYANIERYLKDFDDESEIGFNPSRVEPC